MNTTFLINLFILFKAVSTFALRRKVAIVTGGTRGIGKGISESLAKREYDLLLSYNSDYESAIDTCKFLEKKYNCRVELFSGDISLKSTRKKMFKFYDLKFKNTHNLGVVVHNAGQYVGITSGNSEGLKNAKAIAKKSDAIMIVQHAGCSFPRRIKNNSRSMSNSMLLSFSDYCFVFMISFF